jgi:hypothetical protein
LNTTPFTKLYRWRVETVNSHTDFFTLLERVRHDPYAAIIRGEPIPSLDPNEAIPRNGRTFKPASHHWLCGDYDNVEAPEGISPTDREVIEWLIETHLPKPFHEAEYVAQWSASAGSESAGRLIKSHIWFWLEEKANDHDLRAWAQSIGADPALYSSVHIHFTADPIFINCEDPLKGDRLWHVKS